MIHVTLEPITNNSRPMRKTSAGLGRWTLLVTIVAGSYLAAARPAGAQGPLDYSSFQVIAERNIFNANRFGRPPARTYEPPPPPARVEAFTLVGTMSYRKGPFAFFDSSSSEYRKIVPPGGSIADYKVAAIEANQVKLEANTNQVELKVGMQLQRENDGPWQVREPTETYSSTSSRSESSRDDSRGFDSRRGGSRGFDPRASASDSRRGGSRGFDPRRAVSTETVPSTAPSTPAPTLSSDQEKDILKRLMEKRAQELK